MGPLGGGGGGGVIPYSFTSCDNTSYISVLLNKHFNQTFYSNLMQICWIERHSGFHRWKEHWYSYDMGGKALTL